MAISKSLRTLILGARNVATLRTKATVIEGKQPTLSDCTYALDDVIYLLDLVLDASYPGNSRREQHIAQCYVLDELKRRATDGIEFAVRVDREVSSSKQHHYRGAHRSWNQPPRFGA